VTYIAPINLLTVIIAVIPFSSSLRDVTTDNNSVDIGNNNYHIQYHETDYNDNCYVVYNTEVMLIIPHQKKLCHTTPLYCTPS